jgi:hypothetical protein
LNGRPAKPGDLLDGIASDASAIVGLSPLSRGPRSGLNGRPAKPGDLLGGIASDASGERRVVSVTD